MGFLYTFLPDSLRARQAMLFEVLLDYVVWVSNFGGLLPQFWILGVNAVTTTSYLTWPYIHSWSVWNTWCVCKISHFYLHLAELYSKIFHDCCMSCVIKATEIHATEIRQVIFNLHIIVQVNSVFSGTSARIHRSCPHFGQQAWNSINIRSSWINFVCASWISIDKQTDT